MNIAVGIDVSKRKLDVAILRGGKYKTKVFGNDRQGHARLLSWLQAQSVSEAAIGLEATGVYSEPLADVLADAGMRISVINPSQVSAFAQSELSRAKSDKQDSKLIARFCLAHQPPLYQPRPRHERELKALVSRLQALLQMRQQELNRLEVAHPSVQESISAVIERLDKEIAVLRERINQHIDQNPDLKQQRKLIESIPGVGNSTSALFLALVGNLQRFQTAKQLTAFLGLNPTLRESGSSVRGKARLSKTGNPLLRKALYMPALVAQRHNPTVQAFCNQLAARGKCKMSVIGAAMRKLAHLIFGVLRSGKPFDPALASA